MDSLRVQEATLAIAAEARRDWRYASDVIARGFRRARHLASAERREVAERVYGLIRMHRRVDAVCAWLLRPRGLGPADLPARDLDLLRYLVYRVTLEGAPVEAAAAELLRLRVDPAALARTDQALHDHPGLELSYPDWLIERAQAELGAAEARALLEALNQRAPLAVRANTVRIDREQLAARLLAEGVASRPLGLAKGGLELETRVNVFGLRAFREGLFEVQDEASQLIAELCAPPRRSTVVDACAGAGGKTLALGAAMDGQGRLLALDIDERKLGELRRRAARAGLHNVQALANHAAPPGLQAARVLVDAPCSGLGVLRRNPEARWRLTAQEVDAFPARQLTLLESYAPLTAPGGRLIYATCTFLRAENEDVVLAFAARHPEFVVMPAKEILSAPRAAQLGDGTFVRTWPHRHGTDGFFGAVLRRLP
ncbi:MAG TPA: RsmB/NOP family class I SAM-dependent RNA methyltransferase [Polyangia bacterium]|nr:RsmB/NOP family class I SAM-dependent RNA methyltransferase [Polyangia bacterium]